MKNTQWGEDYQGGPLWGGGWGGPFLRGQRYVKCSRYRKGIVGNGKDAGYLVFSSCGCFECQ